MKFTHKNLIIILSIFCLYLIMPDKSYSQNISDNKAATLEKFNVRVTKDSFLNFPESLTLPYLQNKTVLDQKIFLDNNIINFFQPNISLFDRNRNINERKMFMPDIARNASVHNEIRDPNPPNIYDISLSSFQKGENQPVTVIMSNNPINMNYSTISTQENKLTELTLQEILDSSKKFIKQGDFIQAQNMLNAAEARAGNNPWTLAEIADMFQYIKQPNRAIKTYKKAISINPNRIELLYSYALCLYGNNQLDSAEKNLDRIISINPKFMLAYYNLGNIYYTKGRYYKALGSFIEALKLNPLSADTYYNAALTLERLSYKNQALKYYERGLSLKPQDRQALAAIKRLKRL